MTMDASKPNLSPPQINDAIDELIADKSLVAVVDEQGQEQLYPSAGRFFEDLRDETVDRLCLRDVVRVLQQRGLLRLRRAGDGWRWSLTRRGRNAGLANYAKALPTVLAELGLTEAVNEARRD